MDKTQEVISFLTATEGRCRDALFLIKIEYDRCYEHAMKWYEDAERATKYAEENKYGELSFQLDEFGDRDSKNAFFPDAPGGWSIYNNVPDNVDWKLVEETLRNTPTITALPKG